MADFDNATAFARYADFSVGQDSVNPEEDGYPLIVDGYSGTAGKTPGSDAVLHSTTARTAVASRDRCGCIHQVTPS